MMNEPVITQSIPRSFPFGNAKTPKKQPDLHTLCQFPDYLPQCATSSITIMRCLDLLGPLDWGHFPERNLQRNWGQFTIPYAALAAAE